MPKKPEFEANLAKFGEFWAKRAFFAVF